MENDRFSPSQFSAWLRLRTQRRSISNADLAAAVGVSASTIGRWKNGERVPEPENILKLGRALDYDPDLISEMLGRRDPDSGHLSMAVRRLQKTIDKYDWDERALVTLEDMITAIGNSYAGAIAGPDIEE